MDAAKLERWSESLPTLSRQVRGLSIRPLLERDTAERVVAELDILGSVVASLRKLAGEYPDREFILHGTDLYFATSDTAWTSLAEHALAARISNATALANQLVAFAAGGPSPYEIHPTGILSW